MLEIQTLIVDDEPPARKRIRELLAAQDDIAIIGECVSGVDAVHAIRQLSPNLLFLDIQMPGMDGFGVIRAIQPQELPCTVFVTAYDLYAIQAFEVNALDYLLKPFSDERFEMALQRARESIRAKQSGFSDQQMASLLASIQATHDTKASASVMDKPPLKVDRLVIKFNKRVFFLKIQNIDWIEAAGVYVNIHAGRETHLYRETVGGLEAMLEPNQFIRIHRSTIVNIDRILELQPYSHGEYGVVLQDGTKLKLSRSYRARLQRRLGKAF